MIYTVYTFTAADNRTTAFLDRAARDLFAQMMQKLEVHGHTDVFHSSIPWPWRERSRQGADLVFLELRPYAPHADEVEFSRFTLDDDGLIHHCSSEFCDEQNLRQPYWRVEVCCPERRAP